MDAEAVCRIQFSSPPAGNYGYRMDEGDANPIHRHPSSADEVVQEVVE
jgi:hypothetical protein